MKRITDKALTAYSAESGPPVGEKRRWIQFLERVSVLVKFYSVFSHRISLQFNFVSVKCHHIVDRKSCHAIVGKT